MASRDPYKSILVIVTGLLALALIFDEDALVTAALVVGLAAVFISAAARGIEWLWFKLAMALGWINSRILLSVVFYGFLLPMAWFSRWFRKDTLNLHRNHATSVFTVRNHQFRKKDLENIW